MAKKRKVRILHDEIVRLFAEQLRRQRLAHGMTQADLAQRAEVTVTYISRLERAGAAPGVDLVARLAKALGITLTDLLPSSAPPDPLPGLKEQATQLLNALLDLGDENTFYRLNPFMALLVEAATKRGSDKVS